MTEDDLSVFKGSIPVKIPKGSTIYGDAAYDDYEDEDQMLEEAFQTLRTGKK